MKSKIIIGIALLFVGTGLLTFGLMGGNFAFADSQVLDMGLLTFSISAIIGVALIGLSIIFFILAVSTNKS